MGTVCHGVQRQEGHVARLGPACWALVCRGGQQAPLCFAGPACAQLNSASASARALEAQRTHIMVARS